MNIDKVQILNRFKRIKNFKTDTELARFLGVDKTTLSNWKARKTIDWDLLFSKCEHISIQWLITGEDEKMTEPIPEVSNSQPEIDNGSITSLINILKNTLAEKDKQIDRLLSIIEKNNLK